MTPPPLLRWQATRLAHPDINITAWRVLHADCDRRRETSVTAQHRVVNIAVLAAVIILKENIYWKKMAERWVSISLQLSSNTGAKNTPKCSRMLWKAK